MPLSLPKLTLTAVLATLLANVSYTVQSATCQEAIPKIQSIVEEIRPDKRLELFDLTIGCERDTLILGGESTSSLLISTLKEEVQKIYSNVEIKVSYTPEINDFNGKDWGIITVPVASLNTSPKFVSPITTQAVMGTPVRLLKRSNPWVLVQTPDGYTGWVHLDQFEPLSAKELGIWNASQLLVVREATTPITTESGQPAGVLPLGSLIKALRFDNGKWLVELPSGKKSLLPVTSVEFLSTWIKNRKTALLDNPEQFRADLVKSASNLIGTAYLWGGTSSFGVDCSGLIATIFRDNGLIVPRDSDMQSTLPEEIVDLRNLEKGDLVFFGKRNDDAVQISHVGIYAGKSQFIHSLGSVKKGSFNPEASDYDAYEASRFLFGVRLPKYLTAANCIEWISDSPFYSPTPHEMEPCRPVSGDSRRFSN